MSDLHITARQFKALVSPVIPCAGTDDQLPVLNSIHVRSQGEYLIARATDRFRLGVQRLKAPEGSWPEWEALLPLSTVRAVLADFKPSSRDADPQLVLAVGGESLRVKGDGALLDMLSADIAYPLRDGEFPKVDQILATAIAAEPEAGAHAGFNWKFLSAFAAAAGGSPSIGIKIVSPKAPALISNGEDFLGILMPRKRIGEGWDDILTPPAPAKKKPAAKKAAAKAPAKKKAAVA
jgi:hypothetical protein